MRTFETIAILHGTDLIRKNAVILEEQEERMNETYLHNMKRCLIKGNQ